MEPRYKWLQAVNAWTGEIIEDASFEEEIPKGWYKAFGEKMVDELNEILVKHGFQDKYRIIQVKEKYGGLRWYDNGVPVKMHDEYTEWLHKYEDLSEETCITCGAPATHMTKGWIIPLCDECDKRK